MKKINDIPEQTNVEYKSATEGRLPIDTWQTIGAFSNTDGGRIYFGIDKNGKKVELTKENVDKIQQDIVSLCQDTFNQKIHPNIVVKDNSVVVVIIEPIQAGLRPIYRRKNGINDGSYTRIGSSNVKADGETLKRFVIAAQGGAEKIQYNDNYHEVFDSIVVKNYIELLNNNNENVYQKFSEKEVLIKQQAINKSGDAVTLFGLLAFSENRNLQDIISPTVNIAVTQYPGTSKINSKNLNETYIDNKEFNGPVANQYYGARSFIENKIPKKGIVNENGQREDKPIIPKIAIREALANAIAHRDYSTQSSRIQVDIYQDRIEINNPGTSLIPISELDKTPSMTRNPLLMNYLKEVGIVDQKGRGIRTIVSAIKEEDLVEPKFENIGDKAFRVTLYNTAPFTKDDLDYLTFLNVETNKRQKNAIIYARKNDGGINNGEYRKLNDIQAVRDDKKANQELNDLVKKGVFEACGQGKGRRYLLKK